MDLAGLLGLLRRQWILVGMIMLVAATSAFVTWQSAAPSFRSTAVLSVLPPRVNVEGVPRNPYLDIASASNADIAQRLSIQVNGSEWRNRLTSEGLSSDYLIDHGDATSPILRITIETGSAEQSESTLEAVAEAVEEELATQQERFEINQPSRFTIDTLDRSPGPTRVFGNRTRLTGAILVLGGLAAVIAAQALDNLQRRRRGQRLDPGMTRSPGGYMPQPSLQAPFSDNGPDRPGLWVPRPNVEGQRQPVGTEAQQEQVSVLSKDTQLGADRSGQSPTPRPNRQGSDSSSQRIPPKPRNR